MFGLSLLGGVCQLKYISVVIVNIQKYFVHLSADVAWLDIRLFQSVIENTRANEQFNWHISQLNVILLDFALHELNNKRSYK